MKEPQEYIDEMSDDSLNSNMSIREWYEWLLDLMHELETRIEATKNDLKNTNE